MNRINRHENKRSTIYPLEVRYQKYVWLELIHILTFDAEKMAHETIFAIIYIHV